MTIQFEKICRTCMADNKTLISICSPELPASDTSSLSSMLKAFTKTDISTEDRLPKMMCLSCVSEMNQAFAFMQKCERSETALLSYIKQMEQSKSEPCKEPVVMGSIIWSGDEIEINDHEIIEDGIAPVQEEQIVSTAEHIVYQCVNCSLEFQTNEQIEQHLCSHAKAEYLKPNTNEANVKEAAQFSDTEIQKFNCNHCNGTFTSQRSLTLHVNSQRCLQKTYECDNCSKVFSQKRYLVKHLRRMHLKEDATKAESEGNSEDEVRRKYKCDICSKRFTMMSSLKDHGRIHTGFKPFLCATCGKGFTQAANLRQHLMRHDQNKQFKCSKCSSSFVSKGELITHDRTHTKEHPFVCEICDAGFTTSSSLGKHRRIHTGEKPYGCDLCPLRLTALATLKNHRRTHTGEKPYQCSECNKGFAQRRDCVFHLKTHLSEKSFKCTECESAFRKGASLKLHVKKCHPDKNDKKQTK